MKVICIQKKAFYTLLDRVFKHIDSRIEQRNPTKWISSEEVMEILNIKSRTTLQKMRNHGEIRFSQPSKKVILYDRDSLDDYISKYVFETF